MGDQKNKWCFKRTNNVTQSIPMPPAAPPKPYPKPHQPQQRLERTQAVDTADVDTAKSRKGKHKIVEDCCSGLELARHLSRCIDYLPIVSESTSRVSRSVVRYQEPLPFSSVLDLQFPELFSRVDYESDIASQLSTTDFLSRPTSLSTLSSSSSSSSDSFMLHIVMSTTRPATGTATLVWSGLKHVPRLMPGKLTPELIASWYNTVMHYFCHKEIAENRKVISVTGRFDDPLIQHWFNNDLSLSALDFSAFLQDKKDHFEDWVMSLEHVNLLLEGTPGFYNNTRLHHHIGANAVRELRLACSRAEVLRIKDYKEWKEALSEIDARRLEECAIHFRDLEKMLNDRSRTGP
ncbi:hypothetical protein QCA50_012463 [Cerrena zonata]|uniref:Uncharacterized protein n=1 Tax=Cerrena zonata TaxID=2478898 RepID=A0AAW0FUK5_9APHY